ncbi:MAG: ribosome biogenesis GTPase YlqF, partial [Nodularia sp. (in: Bacteria)]
KGDVERTARHLLTDFRKGLLGTIPLELPPNL